jgi:hypothetical protein
MKKFAIGLFCLALVAVFCHLNSQTDRPVWKGKIVIEDGVRVVKNPSTPLYGEFAFDLQEDLAIGGDPGREDYYFPKGARLSVDDDGNIYVCDGGNRRIQMYDKSGQYVRTIGRQGQGPGEYMSPSQVLFGPGGDLYVHAGREIIIYGNDGTYKNKVLLMLFLSPAMIGSDGTIITTRQPSISPGGHKRAIVQLKADGSILRTVAEFQGELSEGQNVIVYHWYGNSLAFSPITNESFCYGFSDEYKIYVADIKGQIFLIVTKEEKSQAISGKEKDTTKKDGIWAAMGRAQKYEDYVVFPDHRPFFRTILNDDAGRLCVFRLNSILEKYAPSKVDVFSKDGIYLYNMTWPFIPAAIKHGFLYEVRTDKETGEVRIVRHRIKNWSRMATS